MYKLLLRILMAAGLTCSFSAYANQPAWVDSKEYKVLLAPERFATNAEGVANVLLQDIRVRLQQLEFDKPVDGSFVPDGTDQVVFYDTPDSCLLQGSGYSLRLRQGSDDSVQFKYRHADEELSDATDVSGAGTNKKTKLETDISPSNLVYSHSTSQDLALNPPHTLNDVIAQFPGASVFAAQGSTAVLPVNALNIRQVEYSGPSSDLGKSTAKFTVSLWYLESSDIPALVELSFKVKADATSYFTTPVLQRSQTLMHGISTMSEWVLSPSTTKTAWIYNYRSPSYPNGFCSKESLVSP